MFVANCSRFEKIIGIFLCLCLGNIFLDVLVESDSFVQIDSFKFVKIDIIVDLCQLFLLFFTQNIKCLLLRHECIAQKTAINLEIHSGIEIILSRFILFFIFDCMVRPLHHEEQHDFLVWFLTSQMKRCIT